MGRQPGAGRLLATDGSPRTPASIIVLDVDAASRAARLSSAVPSSLLAPADVQRGWCVVGFDNLVRESQNRRLGERSCCSHDHSFGTAGQQAGAGLGTRMAAGTLHRRRRSSDVGD